jgi:HPt (histidine-containing phosphotransfer) domain-containing protein
MSELLEMEQIEDIADLGKDTVLNLIADLEQNLSNSREQLKTLVSSDKSKLKNEIHTLKGQFLNLGFKACSGLCKNIESSMELEDQVIENMINEIFETFDKTKVSLEKYLETHC